MQRTKFPRKQRPLERSAGTEQNGGTERTDQLTAEELDDFNCENVNVSLYPRRERMAPQRFTIDSHLVCFR